jgi:hypothetical protein
MILISTPKLVNFIYSEMATVHTSCIGIVQTVALLLFRLDDADAEYA